MDDFTLDGPEDVVDKDIAMVTSTRANLGLNLNVNNCKIVYPNGVVLNSPFLRSFKYVMLESTMLLGPLHCLDRTLMTPSISVALIYPGPSVVPAQLSLMTLCFCCVLASVLLRSSTFCIVPHVVAINLYMMIS